MKTISLIVTKQIGKIKVGAEVFMKKIKMNMSNTVITGMMVGAALGVVTSGVVKSKKHKLQKNVSKALNSVGEMIQNVSSYIK